MIQRLQTVYLTLAALLLAVPVIIPGGIVLSTIEAETGTYFLFAEKMIFQSPGELDILNTPYGLIAALMIGLFLSVYSIMQYKNRGFQMKLVQLAIVIQLVFAVLVFFYTDSMLDIAAEGSPSYSPVIGVMAVVIVLYLLALRGIKKDDALVRSADRLR